MFITVDKLPMFVPIYVYKDLSYGRYLLETNRIL